MTTITGRVSQQHNQNRLRGGPSGRHLTVGGSQEPVSSDTFKLCPVCQLSLTWQNVEQF